MGGVRYIEVYLQQKLIGGGMGAAVSVQTGGVHYIEMFIDGGFTVYIVVYGNR